MSYSDTSEVLSNKSSTSEEDQQSTRYLLIDHWFLISTRQNTKPSSDDIDLYGQLWDGDQFCGYDVFKNGYKLIELLNDLYENHNFHFVGFAAHENAINTFIGHLRKAAEDRELPFPPDEAFSSLNDVQTSTIEYDQHPKAAATFIENHIQQLFELRHPEVVDARGDHIAVVNQKRFAKEFQKLGYQTYQGSRPYSDDDFNLFQTLHAVVTHAGTLDQDNSVDHESSTSDENDDSSSQSEDDEAQKPKISGKERFVNTLFWIGMGLTVIGLIIYGSIQIHRWRKGEPLHYFKLGKKGDHNPTVITTSSTDDDNEATTKTQVEDKLEVNKVRYFKPKVKNEEQDDKSIELESNDSYKFHLGRKGALKPDYVDYHIKSCVYNNNEKIKIRTLPGFADLDQKMFEINDKILSKLKYKLGKKAWNRVNSRFPQAEFILNANWQIENSPTEYSFDVKPSGFGFYNYYNDLEYPVFHFTNKDELFQQWGQIAFDNSPDFPNTPLEINTIPEELAHHSYYWYYNGFMKAATDEEREQLFKAVHEPLIQEFCKQFSQEVTGDIAYNQQGVIQLTQEQTEQLNQAIQNENDSSASM